jgi:enamine deaminase RidA (YjgF/YER057c/UK114 family)
MSKIEARLAELGVVLPSPVPPVATYVPFVRSGNLVHISGQVSTDASGGTKGVVGVDTDFDTAVKAARCCGINLIAQMKAACDGDLDRVVRIVKLGGFVQAGPDFFDIPKVVNGCSDLMVEVFGDAGRHARSAVGVYRLPLNFSVEVDAVIEVR